jgi:hypothetical protein
LGLTAGLNGSQHLLAPRFSVQLDLEASGQHRDHLLSEAAAFLTLCEKKCLDSAFL